MPLTLKVRHCHYVSKNLLYPAFGICTQKYSRTCSERNLNNPQIRPVNFDTNPNSVVPIFRKALQFVDNAALKDSFGIYTYTNLVLGAKEIANNIRVSLPKVNEKVAFLCPNNASSIVTLWGIWMAGHAAVPLNPTHPEQLLEQFCSDSEAKLLITTSEYAETMNKIAKKIQKSLIVLDANLQQDLMKKTALIPAELECGHSTEFYAKENALVLFSFDKQQKPKGVLLSHKNLQSQINSQINTWKWSSNDTILHALPLHQFHGITNALLCPMSVGAQCTMLPKFDPTEIWSHLLAIKYNGELDHRVTVFMADPFMYSKLVQEYSKLFAKNPRMVEYIKNALKTRLRLMLNAASPLSQSLFAKWTEITGHKLMDTFGSPETGTCLATSLDAQQRSAGFIGAPLDGVAVRVAKRHERHNALVEWSPDKGTPIVAGACADEAPSGELLVKGDQVCAGYLEREEGRFTKDGWFVTGDTVRYDPGKRMLQLVDDEAVIKTGDGEVAVTEVEHQLLAYPDVVDCAVVGLPGTDGERTRIAAVVVTKSGVRAVEDEIKVWAKERLPEHAVPTEVRVVDCLPKSVVGRVNRGDLVEIVFPDAAKK